MYISGKNEAKAASAVIESMNYFRYGGGVQANEFEKSWTKMIGCKETVVLTSGTASLQVALTALGVGPGDSVLIPAYTYIATPLAVTSVGAIPIYVDIDDQLSIDAADAARKVRKHTKAIIPVHMTGNPCNMNAIKKLAKEKGLFIVEDACQAAGGSYKGKRFGSIGDAGAFSFNQYKIISCGEGGCATINNKAIIGRARCASDGGLCVWDEAEGLNDDVFCAPCYRFNNINASILLEQQKRLDGILKSLRSYRARVMTRVKLPEGCSFVTSHCEEGVCGINALIRCSSVAQAEAVEAALAGNLGGARPINSGRHVYSHWTVINEKRGGHHPDWDCFKHPKNQKIKTHYDKKMRQTDDNLARTIQVSCGFKVDAKTLSAKIKAANIALKAING